MWFFIPAGVKRHTLLGRWFLYSMASRVLNLELLMCGMPVISVERSGNLVAAAAVAAGGGGGLELWKTRIKIRY
jgi:hypothetical protein